MAYNSIFEWINIILELKKLSHGSFTYMPVLLAKCGILQCTPEIRPYNYLNTSELTRKISEKTTQERTTTKPQHDYWEHTMVVFYAQVQKIPACL